MSVTAVVFCSDLSRWLAIRVAVANQNPELFQSGAGAVLCVSLEGH